MITKYGKLTILGEPDADGRDILIENFTWTEQVPPVGSCALDELRKAALVWAYGKLKAALEMETL